MTTADKLIYLDETKQMLRQAINATGGALTELDPFREYADQILWGWLVDAQGGLDLDYVNDRYRVFDPAYNALVEKPWADIVNNYSAPAGRTYFDSSGVLQTAGTDEMIRAYGPATGEFLGNQILGSYTCLNQYSFDPNNAAWGVIGGSKTSYGSSVGLFTPCYVVSQGAEWHRIRSSQVTGHANYIFAFVYGAGTSGQVVFRARDDTASKECRAAATINSPKILTNDPSAGTLSIIKDVAITGTSRRLIVLHFVPANAGNTFSFCIGPGSSVVGETVLCYAGCVYAAETERPLVQTLDTPVTIAAENQIIDGTVFSDIWNSAGGTLFIECSGAINAVALKAAGVEVIVDSASNKKYAVAYTSDPSATSLIIGANLNGYIRRIVYFRKELPASLIARLIA